MLRREFKIFGLSVVLAAVVVPSAQAAMAVIDVSAVAQLVQQIRTLQQQLDTARSQLTQAQTQYQSTTGARGMERLLNGTVRNYLPQDWAELAAAIDQTAVDANAVLTAQQLALLSSEEREHLDAARRSTALLQVTARAALATTSSRFASIQQLIDAIGRAPDQKAILDLQARIQAEQGMLANEQTKLQTLYQTAQAEEWARKQRAQERAIADIGSFRDLPPMGLR